MGSIFVNSLAFIFGMIPPIAIRFFIGNKPFTKRNALIMSISYFFVCFIISIFMPYKISGFILFIIVFLSYMMFKHVSGGKAIDISKEIIDSIIKYMNRGFDAETSIRKSLATNIGLPRNNIDSIINKSYDQSSHKYNLYTVLYISCLTDFYRTHGTNQSNLQNDVLLLKISDSVKETLKIYSSVSVISNEFTITQSSNHEIN